MFIGYSAILTLMYILENIYCLKKNKISIWFKPGYFESKEIKILSEKFVCFQLKSSIYICLILITSSILFTYIGIPNSYAIVTLLIFHFFIYIIKIIAVKKDILNILRLIKILFNQLLFIFIKFSINLGC